MTQRNRFFIPREDKRLGDRYQLLEQLGDGSYGWVWRAEKLENREIVALKIPKEQGASNDDLAEGSALVNKTRHPNVVSVFWMGRVPPEREWYAIEMEYFPSRTLSQLLDNGDRGFVASYARILGIYEQVLAGVGYLHELGMSHGDIKPQNVLVQGDRAKITDFGCSVLPEDMYTRTRENGGTILYSAPEVVGSTRRGRGRSDIFSADIYSLGVLLYHLVTSRLPHDTLSQVARHSPFARPREINRSVCPSLEDVILRCLAASPEDRWTSIAELVTATQRARQAQLDYVPERSVSVKREPTADWSSDVIGFIDKSDYARAESVARAQFELTGDQHAFLMMVSAAVRDGRVFDAKRDFDAHPDLWSQPSTLRRDLRELALKCFLETRDIDRSRDLIETMLAEDDETPNILLKKASVLGLQAQYQEASEILLRLNRDFPGRPAVLRRLVVVFEQLRDLGKASAFLKAYGRVNVEDAWVKEKREKFSALGFR
ncbi:MAG: protein kinase [Rhodopirellula sp.]|nr:protein kinase [Rhodopirellula sp.]